MKTQIAACSAALAFLLFPSTGKAQVPGTGRIKVTSVQSYSGTQILSKPASIVVYNFATSEDEVKLNKGALNRVRTKISGDEQDEKTKLAHKVADDFSEKLMSNLKAAGIPVVKGATAEPPPENSLAVQGDFLLIDDGNRARRMTIGLGAGASKVQIHVACSVKQGATNIMFTEFKATAQSSRKPGAAETMGAGAAPEVAGAASGLTEMKQGAEGDADRLAKAIAKEIIKQFKSRGWIETTK